MSSTDSSDESTCENNFQYWNDWQKPDQLNFKKNIERKKNFRFLKRLDIENSFQRKKNLNWIPPTFFSTNDKLKNWKSKINDKNQTKMETDENKVINLKLEESFDEVGLGKIPSQLHILELENLINVDWGKRVQLNDVMDHLDDSFIWGVVNLGCFDVINLWINKYGKVCGLAEGTIAKVGFPDKTKIFITNVDLLQKMLGISNAQWISLCEMVQQSKKNLKFNAFNNVDFEKITSLEKMWYFICKRRHFLPDQCMLLKFNGVIKSLREFKIIPKLIVQDIRNLQNEKESKR